MLLSDVSKKSQSQYKPGENPNSLDNLNREGRPTVYDENKKQRAVVVTDTGWKGFQALAKLLKLSASELVEQIGRGTIALADLPTDAETKTEE